MYLDIIILISTLFCFASCDVKRYDNYTLFRGVPETEEQLDFFLSLEEKYDVNFWSKPSFVNNTFDFAMKPENIDAFMTDANYRNIKLNIVSNDIQRAFDEETVKTYIKRRSSSYDWTSYYRLRDIYEWITEVCYANPHETGALKIGRSVHGRDIVAIKLALREKIRRKRPKVIIEGGAHAREWITIAFITYMFDTLLKAKYSDNEELKTVAFAYEWYFVPILNPDGYEYTHTHDRLWRKNRRGDYGVDLNRNFGVNFGTSGASFNKSSLYYCGQTEFSEPETKALAKLVTGHAADLLYYISIHNYAQAIILPYEYTKEQLGNYNEVYQMVKEAAKKISEVNNTKYTIGTSFKALGRLLSGTSTCWVKTVFEVPYAISIELPGRLKHGFAIPPDAIIPLCEETMVGMVSFLTPRPFVKLNKFGTSKDNAANYISSGIALICCVLMFLII